jgi:hypothetical protein
VGVRHGRMQGGRRCVGLELCQVTGREDNAEARTFRSFRRHSLECREDER